MTDPVPTPTPAPTIVPEPYSHKNLFKVVDEFFERISKAFKIDKAELVAWFAKEFKK